MIDRIATLDETLARLAGRRSSAGMRAALDVDEDAAAHTDAALYADAIIADEDRARRLRF
jgi:hypothetical protein